MPFHLRPLADTPSLSSSSRPSRSTRRHDNSDPSDTETTATQAQSSGRSRPSFLSQFPPDSYLPTTAPSSPIPSRAPSPLPYLNRSFISSTSSSTYGSDTDEPISPLLRIRNRRPRWLADENRSSWWSLSTSNTKRRRRKREGRYLGPYMRFLRRIVRLPYIPSQPTTIVLSLLLFCVFALLVTLMLIHILNPDKEPLPWREYCSLPPRLKHPPALTSHLDQFILDPSPSVPEFPPPGFDIHPPVGILIGVFSTDQAVERRMLIRSTWARHHHSRNGAGEGDGGKGTARTIVRFILGRPSSKWERRIQLEMETYNDLIILPITENMNDGKTHAFFSWAASNAWVPPIPNSQKPYPISYSNMTAMPPALALHDPRSPQSSRSWVRPDFVVKCDDDSFVMLSELEAHLRVEMADAAYTSRVAETAESDIIGMFPYRDPLIYWGYLVKNRFMAGELYALSWSLVDWVAADATVKSMAKGSEDKQVAKWMAKHPRASSIRWVSEHCWIYDHPKSGTVYSHGFLFPSEVYRVRRAYENFVQSLLYNVAYSTSPTPSVLAAPAKTGVANDDRTMIYQTLSYSTVSNFGSRYTSPVPNLTPLQSVEALVEGSAMSLLRDSTALGGADAAWKKREGRRRRYDGKRIGGTIVIHFIKRHEWFLETALALLEGDEIVEGERLLEESDDQAPLDMKRHSERPGFTETFAHALSFRPSISGSTSSIKQITLPQVLLKQTSSDDDALPTL